MYWYLQIFITNKSDENQRQAMISIFSSQEKEAEAFALFAGTIKYLLNQNLK
jgi:hypothetical protein